MRRLIARLLFAPTLAWNFLLARVFRIRRWWDRIDEDVIMGAFPFSFDVPAMKQAGVGAVVNTCEASARPTRAYETHATVQCRLPTVDFTPPSL